MSTGAPISQLIFGIIYYFTIVTNYKEYTGPNAASKETQSKNEVIAFLTCENSVTTTCHSMFCFAARAAHTYSSVGVLPYWPGLCLSAFFPVCTLFYTNACTELNEKLGGEQRGCLMAFLCSFFCACCVIAQDATALDECTGQAVVMCSVQQGGPQGAAE